MKSSLDHSSDHISSPFVAEEEELAIAEGKLAKAGSAVLFDQSCSIRQTKGRELFCGDIIDSSLARFNEKIAKAYLGLPRFLPFGELAREYLGRLLELTVLVKEASTQLDAMMSQHEVDCLDISDFGLKQCDRNQLTRYKVQISDLIHLLVGLTKDPDNIYDTLEEALETFAEDSRGRLVCIAQLSGFCDLRAEVMALIHFVLRAFEDVKAFLSVAEVLIQFHIEHRSEASSGLEILQGGSEKIARRTSPRLSPQRSRLSHLVCSLL